MQAGFWGLELLSLGPVASRRGLEHSTGPPPRDFTVGCPTAHTEKKQLENFLGRISLKPKLVEHILPACEAGPLQLWVCYTAYLARREGRSHPGKLKKYHLGIWI